MRTAQLVIQLRHEQHIVALLPVCVKTTDQAADSHAEEGIHHPVKQEFIRRYSVMCNDRNA